MKDGAAPAPAGGVLQHTVGLGSQAVGGGVTPSAMSPLSVDGGQSPNPDSHPNPTSTSKTPGPSGKPQPAPRSASSSLAFPLDNEGTTATAAGTKGGRNDASRSARQASSSNDNVSLSTLSTMTAPAGEGVFAGAAGCGKAGGWTDAHLGGGGSSVGGGCGSSAKSIAVVAAVSTAAKTLVSNTINRKHGRTTNGAVVLKVAAWGIEPRLALDKKTHAVLERDDTTATNTVAGVVGGAAAIGSSGRTGGLDEGSRGRQFLKFEAWSTRASASSSPWAAHPSMRRQASMKENAMSNMDRWHTAPRHTTHRDALVRSTSNAGNVTVSRSVMRGLSSG